MRLETVRRWQLLRVCSTWLSPARLQLEIFSSLLPLPRSLSASASAAASVSQRLSLQLAISLAHPTRRHTIGAAEVLQCKSEG